MLESADVIRLSRVSKSIRKTVNDLSTFTFWDKMVQSLGIPPLEEGMTERQLAKLVLDESCSICDKRTSLVDYYLRVRLCTCCKRLTGSARVLAPVTSFKLEYPTILSTTPLEGATLHAFVPDAEVVVERWKKLTATRFALFASPRKNGTAVEGGLVDDGSCKKYLNHRRELVGRLMRDGEKLQQWHTERLIELTGFDPKCEKWRLWQVHFSMFRFGLGD
ncbi:hypothetical protein T439DRAFT_221314 [Meredithblackwellia eburnea MCA 4105]